MSDTKAISDWKVADIKKALKQRGLSTKGIKARLIRRLEEAIAKEGTDHPKVFVISDEEKSTTEAPDSSTLVENEDCESEGELPNPDPVDTSQVESSSTTQDESKDDATTENCVVELIELEEDEEGNDQKNGNSQIDVKEQEDLNEVDDKNDEGKIQNQKEDNDQVTTTDQDMNNDDDTKEENVKIVECEEGTEKMETNTAIEIDDEEKKQPVYTQEVDQDSLRLCVEDDDGAMSEYLLRDLQKKESGEEVEIADEEKQKENTGDTPKKRRVEIIDVKKISSATEASSKSQQCPSTASKDTKTDKSEEGPNYAKQKDGHLLMVNGLCADCTASDIKSIFQKYGKIVAVKVISNTKTTGLRRFAQVEMASEEVMNKCISTELFLHGHPLSVEKASVDRSCSSPTKNVNKSEQQSETDNSTTAKKTDDAKKENADTTSGSKDKSNEQEKDKGHKEVAKDKSNTAKDVADKDKGKEKPKSQGKSDKDKKSDGKNGNAEPEKEKSSTDASKPGGGNKIEPRYKDPRALEIDRRRFNASRPRGYHRGNEGSSSGPPNSSASFSRPIHSPTAPYSHRGRGGRGGRPPPISSSRSCLTFDKIREHREQERMREIERKLRERERRRRDEEEKQRMIEKRNRDEYLHLERERQQIRLEREKVERDKMELIRLERERQRAERDRMEKEKEELRRAQQKMDEHSRRMLKRSFTEDKDYVDRKKTAISDIRRFEGTGRQDDFPSRHESKQDIRVQVARYGVHDPRIDRGHMPRPVTRDFLPLSSSRPSSSRHLDLEKEWQDRDSSRELSRIEPKKINHGDDRRGVRIRGRETPGAASDYEALYRSIVPTLPTVKAPERYADHKDFSFSGRSDWDRRPPPSSVGAPISSVIPSHSAAPRNNWICDRKADTSWPSSDKLTVSDRWMAAGTSSMSTGIGVRSSSSTTPSMGGLPTAAGSPYSSATSSNQSGVARSGQPYSASEPVIYRFRRF